MAYMNTICLKYTGTKLICKPFAEWPKYKGWLAAKKQYEEDEKKGVTHKKSQKPKASNNKKDSGKECARLCWHGSYVGCNMAVKNGERKSWAGSWNDQVSSLKVTKGCKLTA